MESEIRGPRRALTAVFVFASCFYASLPAAAERPEPPPFYAIRDARVMAAPGEVLERATVLIADGLIEAVGPELKIPGDAWVVDGAGLTLYPGLINALSDLGQGAGEEPSGSGPARGGPPPARGPEDRPGTTPWVDAADLIADDPRIGDWREAGFTAAVTVPAGGFFAGRAALVHLGEGLPGERVLASGIAQSIAFRRGGRNRGFPGSLMGGIAYVRQVLSDAEHYGRVSRLYAESPQGRERPPYDRALAPLTRALDEGLPFLMPADRAREIDRVLALAGEHRLRAIVHGGQGAYERVVALDAGLAGVVVDLDWPKADKDPDPDADTPLPTIYHRRKAPSTPAALHAAGVPFAFTAGGLSSPQKVFEKLRVALEAGLDADAALEAFTVGAARLYGIDDRLGTIEAGKIANLVLATAEPWADDVEVRAVFVDGRKYQERGEVEDSEPPTTDVSGTWALELSTPRGARELTAELKMTQDGKVTGELTGERGTRTLEKGRVSGELLTFKTTQTMGQRTFEASYSLEVEGDRLEGTMSAGPRTMDLSGERTAEAKATAESEEEPAVTLEELERAMAAYRGPVRELGTFAITGATVYAVAGAPTKGGRLNEPLEDATVLVEDGKIRAVGTEVKVPRGAEVIDAEGGSLIPGIIDAHSHIAAEGGLNEGTIAVSSMVSVGEVIDPTDVAIYRALAGGVTTINVLHGSSNPIGGGNAVLKLRWGKDAPGLLLEGAPPGIKFALGENPKRSRRDPPPGTDRRYPATRMGVMDVIRDAFGRAREYRKSWQRYERQGKKAGATPPRRDLQLEPLVEILNGERLVHAHCYRADEILQLMRVAEEQGFRIATLQHVLEGYKVADEIASHGAGASTFSDWWGYKVEAYDAIPHNAALMTERGVTVSINSDSGEEMRHLNQEAAKAVKWGGLDEVEALALVTLNPAKQLGIDARVGSIEVGKDADLVLYDGHPLSIFSVVRKTFVDGDLYFDREADRERQAQIDQIKEKLAAADDKDKDKDKDEDAEEEAEGEPAEEEPEDAPPERRDEGLYSCREEG